MEKSSEERVRVKSPVSVNGAIGTTESFSEAVTEILNLLGSKGTTFETALFVLDKVKEALHKCKMLQDKYTP